VSSGRADTRAAILTAARAQFEEQGYFGAAMEAVAKKAGVSRQAIYLHFASKADLLSALHLHIFETDVQPALERHPVWTAPSSLDALDASIAVDAEVASKVWQIHETFVMARRHHPEVDDTLRPREAERYAEIARLARWLKDEGVLAPGTRASHLADSYWGLTSTGTFVNLVIERGWSLDRFKRWVRDLLNTHLATGR
jgi:AcrR family transcriptional regulator